MIVNNGESTGEKNEETYIEQVKVFDSMRVFSKHIVTQINKHRRKYRRQVCFGCTEKVISKKAPSKPYKIFYGTFYMRNIDCNGDRSKLIAILLFVYK